MENIIYDKDKLAGLINFLDSSMIDPKCDLMIGYTVLNKESLQIFKDTVS